jgi:putative hemolysin
MGIKSVGGLFGLFKELSELKRKAPEIKLFLHNFEKSENPKEHLKKMVEIAKNNPVIDNFLMGTKSYHLIEKAEENAERKGWSYACLEAVKEMGVKVEIIGKENIPYNNPSFYISNHPYGSLDSVILVGELGSILNKKDKELKLIGMNQLRFIKGIEEILYFVHTTTSSSNFNSLKDSLRYLDNGGNLVICPSGIMSRQHLKECPWKNTLTPFIAHSYYVVPMWFSGPDHEGLYNLVSRYEKKEKLRRAFSFREAWNKQGKTIYLKIGTPLPSECLMGIKDGKERMEYLRRCAENLKLDI